MENPATGETIAHVARGNETDVKHRQRGRGRHPGLKPPVATERADDLSTASERGSVDARIFDAFVGEIADRIHAPKVGTPLDETTDMGPKTCDPELETVERMVRRAVAQGATLVLGGHRLTGGLDRQGPGLRPAPADRRDARDGHRP